MRTENFYMYCQEKSLEKNHTSVSHFIEHFSISYIFKIGKRNMQDKVKKKI